MIQEDAHGHANNVLWAYDLTNGSLTRVLSSVRGAEVSGGWVNAIGGRAYLTMAIQHPFELESEGAAGNVTQEQAQRFSGYMVRAWMRGVCAEGASEAGGCERAAVACAGWDGRAVNACMQCACRCLGARAHPHARTPTHTFTHPLSSRPHPRATLARCPSRSLIRTRACASSPFPSQPATRATRWSPRHACASARRRDGRGAFWIQRVCAQRLVRERALPTWMMLALGWLQARRPRPCVLEGAAQMCARWPHACMQPHT